MHIRRLVIKIGFLRAPKSTESMDPAPGQSRKRMRELCDLICPIRLGEYLRMSGPFAKKLGIRISKF
jgi:hypothetical protein